jgi:hypothetical protein
MRAPADSTPTFRGASYDPQFDRARLSLQIERIRSYMLSVEWRTLREIKAALEDVYAPAVFPESSISAQLRNLKKPGYSYRLLRRRRVGVRGPGAGIFEYRLLAPTQAENVEIAHERRAPDPSRVDAGSEPDDQRGREEFLREARRIASLESK